jgi:uncharacterized SAM-binding protein YcdF (DUF218 family)
VFHFFSKLLFLFVQPSMVCLALIAAGLLLNRKRLAVGGFGALLVIGFSPLGNLMILPLEQRFERPALDKIAGQVSGIIILGGFEDGYVSSGRGGLAINEAGDRLTEALVLANRLPKARVVFTGGAGNILETVPSTAPAVAEFLIASGVAKDRLVMEGASRNTIENALFTRDMLKPKPGERWLLVTSAFHIPRSMGLFRKAGFDVVAWPVDYRTAGPRDSARFMGHLDEGLKRVDTVMKEIVGLAVYRLRGWTDALFPGPV